jgi:protein O-mannosyl-transferase
MRVESVAWIAERKDLLSGVFFALTLAAYLYYSRGPSFSRYVALTIAVVCGLMSKATFVTVPLVLLLLDYWPLERWQDTGSKLEGRLPALAAKPGRLVLEKLPLIALSLAASAATIYAQTQTIASLEQLALLPRIKNAAVSIIIYLRQMAWPSDLAVFYPHPRDHLDTWIVLGSFALILAITLVALLLMRKFPYLFVGWFWFLILLFPVLGFFQSGLQARADRFTYLPHIGITIAATWTITDLMANWRYRRAILAPLASCIVVVFTICSWKQTTYWRDSVSLWRRDLAVTSDNQVGHQNLAAALWARGDLAQAKIEARTASIIHSESAVKDFPLDITARDELGFLLLQAGEIRDAIAQWQTSLQIDPHDGNALTNLAWIFATYPDDSIRNGTRAIQFAESAAQLPGGAAPIVQRTLAAAYAESGDFEKAIQVAQRAAELAQSQGNTSLVETLRHEAGLYQSRTPYREKPPE